MLKLTLRSIGPYFFGTERGYGTDNAVYFATSKRFPQQSTVLGMLRYRLLEMRGWLYGAHGNDKSTYAERSTLIGPKSFRPSAAARTFDFGALKSISPVWLEDKTGLMLPGPLDRDYAYATIAGSYTTLLQEQPTTTIPVLGEHFDYKDTVSAHLRRVHDRKSVKMDAVFVESNRIGITKDRVDGDSKAFFKQQNFQLDKTSDARFVCYVDIDKTSGKELISWVAAQPLVTMGGERSVFHMTLTEEAMPATLPAAYQDNNSTAERWVLLSDAFIPTAIQARFDFAVSNATFYRGLVSNTEKTEQYANLHSRKPNEALRVKKQLQKSDGYPLLQRGSVLYPPTHNSDRLAQDLLQATRGWYQIGYNRIARIRPGQASFLTLTDQNQAS